MYKFKLNEQDFYQIRCITPSIFQVKYSKKEIVNDASSLMVNEDNLKDNDLIVKDQQNTLDISSNVLKLSVDKANGKFTWFNTSTNKVLLHEGEKSLVEKDLISYHLDGDTPIYDRVKTVDGERNFIKNMCSDISGSAYRGKINFEWEQNEGIYGLGQGEEGIFNYRHHNQYLYQHNMRIPMPILVSSNKYGIFADCNSLMTFNDDVNGSYLFFDSIKQLEYYFVAGDDFNEIVKGFRLLTGKASMLPKWAFGYIQSKETYQSAEELENVVSEYRCRKIPLDCIVQDWKTWEDGKWGEKTVDKVRYPNLKVSMEHIHDMNAHAMVSIWPNVNADGNNYKELDENGHILMDMSTYDAFNEEARELYWKQANEELFSGGFDAWWCDSTEPFSGPDWNGAVKREPWERYEIVGCEHQKFLGQLNANAFALMHSKGMYENQRKTDNSKRVTILSRSGYPSIQKYGTILWSGDTFASWETLKKQITEGLSMSISGYPYWTLDIGGFFTVHKNTKMRGCDCSNDTSMKWFWQGDYEEGVADYAYRELYTRWLQYGTFLPIFRSHGTDTPREIWNFGEKGTCFYDAIEKFINLRYTLMPYIYSTAAKVHFEDTIMMKSLSFDYLEDITARDIHNEFLFGSSFLICPVTTPMYYDIGNKAIEEPKELKCYLPKGNKWYDFWTDTVYEGGQYVIMNAEIDKIPIFVKEGSIIPVSEGIQYAAQPLTGKQTILIYPGKDADFILYEDEGDNYHFEQGAYATTHMHWDEKSRLLEIADRKGEYPGMIEVPEYEIVIK